MTPPCKCPSCTDKHPATQAGSSQQLASRKRIEVERDHELHAAGKSLRSSRKPAVQIRIEITAKERTMAHKPRKDARDDFGHFKSEPMKFVLYLVRELRFAFQAAAASWWITWWICSTALVGSASWATKNLFVP